MALLDKLLGGGAHLELRLDTAQIPQGGRLSGHVSLTGGKRPLPLTSLKVRLVDAEAILLETTIAANIELPPASVNRLAFTIEIPKGADLKASYLVVAVADLPGVKDPSASVELRVIAASSLPSKPALDGDALLLRFPGLTDESDERITGALHELSMAAYEPDTNLIAAEPILSRLIKDGSERVREAALRAWGTILNNRARPEHIQVLTALVENPILTKRLMREVIEVAAKFAEEGALPLVRMLATHPDPEVREELALQLYLNTDPKLKERKQLLVQLAGDQSPSVRATAYRAFATFADDQKLVSQAAAALSRDDSPDVQKAIISAIAPAHFHGQRDLVFDTLLLNTKNPHAEVRAEVADSCHWLPKDARLSAIVSALLTDASVEVRRRMAQQAVNMSEHPELASLFVKAATQDPAPEVRADALSGLARIMPLADAVAIYRERLASDAAPTVAALARMLLEHAQSVLAE